MHTDARSRRKTKVLRPLHAGRPGAPPVVNPPSISMCPTDLDTDSPRHLDNLDIATSRAALEAWFSIRRLADRPGDVCGTFARRELAFEHLFHTQRHPCRAPRSYASDDRTTDWTRLIGRAESMRGMPLIDSRLISQRDRLARDR